MYLLDINLPDGNGFSICSKLKEKEDVAIIFLTARDDEKDIVKGLDMGADDYIVKPFDSKELVARVKAVLRRYNAHPKETNASGSAQGTVEYPGLKVSLADYTVIYNDERIDMPPKELELLYFLASSPNQVFTREQLLNNIWGYDYLGDTRTVDVHIKRLREKLPDGKGWSLGTVWGIGYKFELRQ